jgi:Ser/Thr protein kinase RdoA (MazF antagonist)
MGLGIEYGKIVLDEYLANNRLSSDELKELPFLIRYGAVRRMFWLLNEYIKKEELVESGPLNLNTEIDGVIGVISLDLEKLLF